MRSGISWEWYDLEHAKRSLTLSDGHPPSAVIPSEVNYLMNPGHPDFRPIDTGTPMPFKLDLRRLT